MILLGDVLRIKKPKHHMDAKQWMQFAMNDPKTVGLFLFMGTGQIDKVDDDITTDAFLRSMGWEHEEMCGWVLKSAGGVNAAYRGMSEGFPCWVPELSEATRYARRVDAEAVHAEDEQVWSVVTYRSEVR